MSRSLLYFEIFGFYIIPFILASLMGVYGGLTVMLGILCPNVGSPVLVGHHSICHRHFALGFLGEGTLSACCSSPRVWRAARLSASPFLQHSAPQRAVHLSTTFKFRITQSNLSRVCCCSLSSSPICSIHWRRWWMRDLTPHICSPSSLSLFVHIHLSIPGFNNPQDWKVSEPLFPLRSKTRKWT